MMLNAETILPGISQTNVFKYQLGLEIGKRRDALGLGLFRTPQYQVRKTLALPYPVQNKYFDKDYKEMETYHITLTEQGAAFTIFWLLPTDYQNLL